MPQVANPAKVLNFIIEINGIDSMEVQKVSLPETEIESVEHGGANSKIKTAGMVVIGDCTLEKLKPIPVTGDSAWNWFKQAQDTKKGGGQLSNVYKKIVVIKEMYPNNTATARRWILDGAWIKKISQSDLDRNSSDNIIETCVLSVDDVDKK